LRGKTQLIELTKQVLAASLAIEEGAKVRKTLTIALVLHRPEEGKPADVRATDLSNAKAADAYWARADFTYADFFKADLARASFRKSVLHSAQFREATLRDAVLAEADCQNANFKLADLRGVNFDGAMVGGCVLAGARFGAASGGGVDLSEEGDGSQMVSVQEWCSAHAA
jgi:uncharacterized protein YjbI with pentapeptide repeats